MPAQTPEHATGMAGLPTMVTTHNEAGLGDGPLLRDANRVELRRPLLLAPDFTLQDSRQLYE